MLAKLFSPPRFHENKEHRAPTWTELFYDLVYVATFIQLGNHLSDNVSVEGFIYFLLLFIAIWWSWIGTTFYTNRFDSDDVEQRLFVFAQIFTVSLMAVFAYDAFGETSAQFALAYATNRFILVLLYWRVVLNLPNAKGIARGFATGFFIAAALWTLSAFVPAPLRFILWTIALLIDFATPFSLRRYYAEFPVHNHHASERLALLTIIVFGEGFIKVIGGLADGLQAGETKLTLQEILFNSSGLLIAVSLWWVYFENVAGTKIKSIGNGFVTWLYTHLPYHVSITALGVALYKTVIPASDYVLSDNYRWLLASMIALSLVTVAIIEQSTEAKAGIYKDKLEFSVRIIGALVVLLITAFSGGMSAALFLGLLSIPSIGQVLFDLYRRISSPDSRSVNPLLK